MSTYNPNNVKIGPGTLYAAPLGTAEPTSVSGVWPTGWVPLGYTDQGSEFDFGPTTAPVEVEEELWPIRIATTGYTGKIMFALAETTRQNLALGLNCGIGAGTISASQGTNADGSLWQDPPAAGSEVRVMLGWDAIPEAGTTALDPWSRFVIRQALMSGTIKRVARKGNNKSTFALEFSLEKPPGVQAFRYTFEPNLAA